MSGGAGLRRQAAGLIPAGQALGRIAPEPARIALGMSAIPTIDLGRVSFSAALEIQRERLLRAQAAAAEGAGGREDCLFLLEHDPPVITLGRRGRESDLLVPRQRLAAMGVEVHAATRGGQATYHGPGQLVGYPVLDLAARGLGVPQYVRLLEETVLRALTRFGIAAGRQPERPGVWVAEKWGRHPVSEPHNATEQDRNRVASPFSKIAAVGVAVSKRVCYHGFALNVCTNMDHFGLIVPCGMPDVRAVSMSELLGRRVEVAEVKPAVAECFAEVFCSPRSPSNPETKNCGQSPSAGGRW